MNTIVIYASMSGTTEQMARIIADELMKVGDSVVVKDAIESYAEELESYDRILIGSYTWGDGDLSDEILAFYEELINTNLTGKVAASFGPGDSNYEHFGKAVEILQEALEKQGCHIIAKGLKVDTWLEDEEEIESKCISFAREIWKQDKEMKKMW